MHQIRFFQDVKCKAVFSLLSVHLEDSADNRVIEYEGGKLDRGKWYTDNIFWLYFVDQGLDIPNILISM